MEGEAVTYCIVERRFALRYKRALRRYAQDAGVEIVVDRRARDRRRAFDRRSRAIAVPEDINRRGVRNPDGRRIAARRATLLSVDAPLPLPRRLRQHDGVITFADRLAASEGHDEDVRAARLIVRIQGGDDALFGDLYDRFFDRVYSYLCNLVDDAPTAEWLTQETFLDLHDSMPTYEVIPAGFREQLATLMRTKAADYLRRTRGIDLDDFGVEADGVRADGGADLTLPDWITDVDLQLLISRLPHAQRQAVMLRYVFGLSEGEIARACGCMTDTVFEMNDLALSYLRDRLALLGREAATPGLRLSALRCRRPARVLQSRRLALLSG